MTEQEPDVRPDAGAADESTLVPLTRELVEAALVRQNLRWKRDEDDDIALIINGALFFVLLQGPKEDVLHVRGSWAGRPPADRADEVAEFCSEWNREKIFPKLYPLLGTDPSGDIRLLAEVSTDLTAGLAPAQLDHLLGVAFGTTLEAFRAAAERFPDPEDGTSPPQA